jgi:plastin-1
MYLLSYFHKVGARHGKEYTDQTVLEEANDRVRSIGKNSMITSYSDPSLKTSRFLLDLISSIEPRAVDDSLFLAG